jgi:hypothetical protein
MRQGHAFKEIDGHQAFEEIRGVIVARTGGVRSRKDYRVLGHPLFGLLELTTADGDTQVDARQSSVEEWQKEARRPELQGKQEQAEAIRRTVLKQTPPPWPVLDDVSGDHPGTDLEFPSRSRHDPDTHGLPLPQN